MAYATYQDVEKALSITFPSSGDPPPIQSDVTNVIAHVEDIAAAFIYPNTLTQANTNNSEALKGLVVEWTIKKLMHADKWRRARGSTSSLEGVTFPESFMPDREILAAFKRLSETTTVIGAVEMVKDD